MYICFFFHSAFFTIEKFLVCYLHYYFDKKKKLLLIYYRKMGIFIVQTYMIQ